MTTPTPARPALDASRLADELERLRDAAVAGEYNPSKMVALQMKAAFNIDTIISSLRSLADMRGEMDMIGGALASIAESQIVERSVDGNHMYTGVGMSALTALATLKAALARGAP